MTQARVDETYIKVKREWKYLYRLSILKTKSTLEFMLSAFTRCTRRQNGFYAIKADEIRVCRTEVVC